MDPLTESPAAPPSEPKAVSAPGKVLLAGGYLVLDQKHTGLVFGLSARINVIAQDLPTSPGIVLNEIIVLSPQFHEAQWRYGYHLLQDDGGIRVTQLQVGPKMTPNPFVEITLSYVLTYVNKVLSLTSSNRSIPSTRLTILADNDYYSHGPGTTTVGGATPTTHHPHGQHQPRNNRFASFATTLSGAHKTGLGSSAALVTAMTGALLAYYLGDEEFDLSKREMKNKLHNLAQTAHCAAQGKIGSGFDVAAAVYGSCVYRRFSQSLLLDMPAPGTEGFASKLQDLVHREWNQDDKNDTEGQFTGFTSAAMPKGLVLRMVDVDCGSATVSMAKKVLEWRTKNPDKARDLWGEIQKESDNLGDLLRKEEIQEVDIRASVTRIRDFMRLMGNLADVPIEPENQTKLLDAVSGVEGVLGGVCPGAGGYDALALLTRDDAETKGRVEEFLGKWRREMGVKVKLLKVEGEIEGARVEGCLDGYKGWI